MNNKQISVLGCGWLGLPLAKHFIKVGYKVKGSTTSEEKVDILKTNGIVPYVLNLGEHNDSILYEAFFEYSDVIIINFPPKRIPHIEKIYRQQLARIMPFISETQKIIFISSTSVYQNKNTWVKEDLEVKPDKASGKAVLNAENLLKEKFKNQLTILRFAGLIGSDRYPGRFLAGKKDLSNGKAPVNVIHQKDCIGLILEIIKQNCWGEIINGCADVHPEREDYYTKAALKIGLEPPTFSENSDLSFKIVSNKKGKEILDFQYQYPNPIDFLG